MCNASKEKGLMTKIENKSRLGISFLKKAVVGKLKE